MNNKEKNTYAKTQLVNATINLLKIKKINEITISELTDFAQVGRATFYRNYTSIEDLLNKEEAILALEFDKNYNVLTNKKITTLLYEISKHYKRHSEFYLTLYKQGLTKIIEKTIITHIKKVLKPNNYIQEYGLNFIGYGLYGWILAWLRDEMKHDPDELLEMIKTYYSEPFDI